MFTPADSPEIRFTGRAAKGPGEALSFDWSGSHFTFRFEGTRCAMRAADTAATTTTYSSTAGHTGVAATSGADSTVVLAEGLERGPHTILVQKRTEGEQGRTTLRGRRNRRGTASASRTPAHATSNSSATRTPAATAPRANRSRSPLRPRPRTAIWRGDASSPAISTPNTPSSPTRDRASSATGATKRRSPTAPCANACCAPSTWTRRRAGISAAARPTSSSSSSARTTSAPT